MKRLLLIFAIISALSVLASAQTTAFNFQGRLNDGSSPANGKYDLEFRLYDALTGGNQLGDPISKAGTTLVNGVFSVQLDFTIIPFYGGNSRFIEVRLRPSVSNNAAPNEFTILGPRQQILSVPYALRSSLSQSAESARNADQADQAVNATNAANAANAQKLGGVDAARFVQQDAGGNVNLTGNLTQPLTANGLPKAIVFLDRNGVIISCYNGITGASTGNCGFEVFHPLLGEYSISFGNGVEPPRPIVVTTLLDEKATVGTVDFGSGSAFRITVRYITTDSDNGKKTNAPLSVVVY